MSRIIKLMAENVKRLFAIEITPDRNMVVIGGNNGAGKSSILDAIAFALGGKSAQCEIPLRQGQKNGYTIVETDDLVVRRTFSEGGGGSLKVTNKEGLEYKSPQTLLDAMVGTLAFDPLAFMRLKAKEQTDTLCELFGIDVSRLEKDRAEAYEKRKQTNRRIRELDAQIRDIEFHADLPNFEISTATVLAELDVARETNINNQSIREEFQNQQKKVMGQVAELQGIDLEISRIERQLVILKSKRSEQAEILEHFQNEKYKYEQRVRELNDIDESPIREKLIRHDGTNKKIRANLNRSAKEVQLKNLHSESNSLTDAIDVFDIEKVRKFKDANLPVPGMTIDDGLILLNGIPLSQCSQAEQLRLSYGVGISQNAKLKVMLIREGSLLDENSLLLLKELAEKYDVQIWLEVVGDRHDCSVIIEDGSIRR